MHLTVDLCPRAEKKEPWQLPVGAVEGRNRRREPDEGTGLGLTLTQCERHALIVSLEEYAHRATARLRAVARGVPARA